MIRLLMATKPRMAPASEDRFMSPPDFALALDVGRRLKGSLQLAADEACTRWREEGTAAAGWRAVVERTAHGGDPPRRDERATMWRPERTSAVASDRRIGRSPMYAREYQPREEL